jgi:hypothetical protein
MMSLYSPSGLMGHSEYARVGSIVQRFGRPLRKDTLVTGTQCFPLSQQTVRIGAWSKDSELSKIDESPKE